MTDFKTYYNSKFRQDINQFFSTIPDESKFHEDKEQKQIYSIQHERLTPQKTHLNFLDKETKEYFGVALYFTVLTDMVFYSHFQSYYNRFQELTRYPKLIGNCLSWCHYHLDPKDIFNAMNQGRIATEQHLIFYDKFIEATEIMGNETISFFNKYIQEINGQDFWDNCKMEFPYKQHDDN